MVEPERRRRRHRQGGAAPGPGEGEARRPVPEKPPERATRPAEDGPGRTRATDDGAGRDRTTDEGGTRARAADGGGGRGRVDEREVERGLRGLVGSGTSQVSVGAALRARDAARPTPQDIAAAEENLLIVRRGWVPRDDLPRSAR